MLQAGKFMPQSTRNSLRQTVISWFLLILLVLIAVVIGFKQKSYQKSGSDSAILSADLFAGNFTAAEDIENYNSSSLYEKIDGKADLYLGNGFVSLQCRRFTDKTKKDSWAEVYLYDMADGENAFAVYSLQKRSESSPLDWVQFGYSASDSVYAAFGNYYMEIILSSQDNSLLASAQNAARQLSSAISAGRTQIPILGFFPAENLVADSFKFIKADAFGCNDLKNIFTAKYKINGNDITAYLSKNSPADTYAKYYRFLIDNGAKDLQHNIKLPDSKAVELFGTNEIFFVTDGFLAGVRGSAPIDDLQKLAEKLIENLPKK
jgi:hypothetical protein